MDVVVIGGPHSGVGKTLAAEIAIRSFVGRRVGAVKLTVADGERDAAHDHGSSARAVVDAAGICGRGTSCGVCESVSGRVPSRLIVHPGAIRKKGTDTCRLADAGAVAVAWVIALRKSAPAALDDAFAYLAAAGVDLAVVEGTTSLEWLRPRAAVMVATDPGRRWKSVAVDKLSQCDIVLHNVLPVPAGNEPAPGAFRRCTAVRCRLPDSADPGTQSYIKRLQMLVGG
jgi:hypothetical protein